jgi:hypothetical protein
LKDKRFSTFLDQNPPFERRPENGVSPLTKACSAQWHVIDNTAIKRLVEGKLSATAQQRGFEDKVARSNEARCGVVAAGLATPHFCD